MIQTVLSFLLGFLVAAAIALVVAPALWRRAAALERRRIEASMPLTREELQAKVDAARAEHAMAMRRLEMKAEAIKKKAAQDLVEINTLREEVKRLGEERSDFEETVAALDKERHALATRLAEREEEAKRLAGLLAEVEESLERRQGEVEELSRLYEEASLISSTRQVELVGREADIERLNDAVGLLRNQRKEADRAAREALAARAGLEEALSMERKRAEEFERKVERQMSELSDRDEKLERQEREIGRLKQKIRDGDGNGVSARLAEAEQARAGLEMEVAELKVQLAAKLAREGADEAAEAAEAPARKMEVERLQARLAAVMRENKKLRIQLAAAPVAGENDEVLREQISSLAAEVVSVAAALDGPDSPIDKALAEQSAARAEEAATRPLSLAERVRALREGTTPAE